MTLRYQQVALPCPGDEPVALWVVHVREEQPPPAGEPLEWFLLTTLPVNSTADATRILQWYARRWRIEEYFRVLKSGCKVEELQHHTAERLERAMAIKMVIGWRIQLMVQLADGTLPLLVPMSEVAGRLSIQAGATSLEMRSGGKGLLLPGVSGVRRGRVTIIGAGVVGLNACVVGVGFGADVTIIDINPLRLAYVRDVVQGHVTTLMSNAANIESAVASADLVLCSVLIAGARTPRLVTRAHLAQMEPGSALVDVAVDQGGCAETSRPTTHHDPRYVEEGVVHYCVSNMPGAVPHTSTYALTNATMAYALEIADRGWRGAVEHDPALAKGVNVVDGQVTHAAVAAAHGLGCVPLAKT